MTTTTRPLNLVDQMTVTVPEGTSGDVRVERFEITEEQVKRSMINPRDAHRMYTPAGTYTRLMKGRTLWMSDTRAERHDHVDFLRAAKYAGNGAQILVSGLGLGMVLGPLLTFQNVVSVDVIEIDEDVITLVGPHLTEIAEANGVELRIAHGDAFDGPKAVGLDSKGASRRWDVAYHDIWANYSTDTYHEHANMRRKFRHVTGQQMFWLEDEVKRIATRERRGY